VIGTAAGPRGFPAPGAGVHAEIARLVAAGLAPAAAIRSATVVPAAFAGAEKTSGQIKPGFSADFFAVDGDPLAQVSDLARIRLVVRNGEVLDRKNLLAMTERAAAGR
jgi:imidazolonepropionase-like amidohydrolase